MILLTAIGYLLSPSLYKSFNRIFGMQRRENIPLQQQNTTNGMLILCGSNKDAVKKLIRDENHERPVLRALLSLHNMKGLEPENRPERRRINKFFRDCLFENFGDQKQALLWLKNHIAFDTCKTMRSDWKYEGKLTKSFINI